AGDRATADSYHYLEMEAKRKQKPSWKRYPELPAQYIFGYGVHPWRVFGTFIAIIGVFTLLYLPIEGATNDSLIHSASASALAMFIPPSVLQNPKPLPFSIIAVIQAIFGLLLWGTFIATLTRKYGR
ncbi:MAG: hypothetical protein ACXV5H_12220, partial [Halobacteriota archaeon]